MKVAFSNYLNLPRKISGTDGTLAKYSYLANGSKTEAEDGSGAGLVLRVLCTVAH